MEEAMTKRVMILATDGFEQSELTGPKERLDQAGFETVVVAPKAGSIRGWQHTDWGDTVEVDMTLDEADASDFDALVLPGKPVAAICHGPWLLVEADAVRGKTVTGWPSIRTDLANAGAEVVDREVARDGNLITSRKPDDITAFSDALIGMLEEQAATEPA
jgi:protease I